MRTNIALIGILIAILLISGCTSKTISMDSLISAGKIKINGMYPTEKELDTTFSGLKSSRTFVWVTSPDEEISIASFTIAEMYSENDAKNLFSYGIGRTDNPSKAVINGVETIGGIAHEGYHFYMWIENNFVIGVEGTTDEYAKTIAIALIESYK